MKQLPLLLASALLAIPASVAHADTVSLASYGSTASAPSGVGNSALQYTGGPTSGSATYDLPTNGIWTAPVGNSSWVGISPTDYPSSGHVEPAGTYNYTTTFTLSGDAAAYTGFLELMADDTSSVVLNGVTLQEAAAADPSQHCTVNVPNCLEPTTINLSGFVEGTNTLSFAVNQDFADATGIDFIGTVSSTPEPSSLLLLGSGLTTMAGFAFRRRRA